VDDIGQPVKLPMSGVDVRPPYGITTSGRSMVMLLSEGESVSAVSVGAHVPALVIERASSLVEWSRSEGRVATTPNRMRIPTDNLTRLNGSLLSAK
jgi:hypothetical protein